MKLDLQSTTRVVEVNGVPARVWQGQTDTGIPVTVLITRIAVAMADDDTVDLLVHVYGHFVGTAPTGKETGDT